MFYRLEKNSKNLGGGGGQPTPFPACTSEG